LERPLDASASYTTALSRRLDGLQLLHEELDAALARCQAWYGLEPNGPWGLVLHGLNEAGYWVQGAKAAAEEVARL
jgi:hypothetical protein